MNMEKEKLKKLFESFLKEYPEDIKNKIWIDQSSYFKEFWNERIMRPDSAELTESEIDGVVRILDSHGKGNNRHTEAIAAAMIPQGAFRRMFNAIRENSVISEIIGEVLNTTSDKVRAEKIDTLYKTAGKSIGYLTGSSGNAINLLLAAWDPFVNSSIVSLNHRNKFINGLGIIYDPAQFSLGEQIVKTNTLITEFFKDLGFRTNSRAISSFAYESDFKDIWNVTEEPKKFESNEDLAFRLLKEHADQDTILAEFRKVYKAKKNITDEDFIKSRVDIYMNIAKKRLNLEQGLLNESNPAYKPQVRYWLYALGKGAKYWDLYYNDGVMGIGPNATGELNQYNSQQEIGDKIGQFKGEGKHSNDSLGLWEFFKVMKPGDVVIAKKGTSSYLGYGIVLTDYLYDFNRKDYHHLRKVSWKSKGEWPEANENIVIKTLTDITKYPDYIAKLKKLLDISESDENEIATTTIEEKIAPYSFDDALSEIFLSRESLEGALDLLEYKKNIILQGPPGTGKTFIAKRLAFLAMGVKDQSKVEMIQFHQSYSYEDFIQGYRPSNDGKFFLQNGIFYKFCLKAQRDPDNKYFFIIDEINRGNLSKIFGELMMLIEHDKRGKDFSLKLTYSGGEAESFYIPENLYLIGTMNTADRSLAIVDYALRRRFVFIDIKPAFNHFGFEELMKSNKVPSALVSKIKSRMEDLNNIISGDDNLRKWFSVGHSYFCSPVQNPDDTWYRRIILNEIGPLLREYWFDDEEKAEENIKKLLRD